MNGNCSGKNRCRNARTCDRCAHERQRQIADVAERLEQRHGQLTFTVLRPEKNTPEAVRALRASFLRRALAPAGIWTIEAGSMFNGLHLNILSPKPAPAKWRGCKTYSELLNVTARDAAAYIAKRSGMPAVEQFAGRLYGSFGQVGAICIEQRLSPVVAAAAIEAALGGAQHHQAESGPVEIIVNETKEERERRMVEEIEEWKKTPKWQRRRPLLNQQPQERKVIVYPEQKPRPERTKEERAEIMRRNLPNLYAAIGQKI